MAEKTSEVFKRTTGVFKAQRYSSMMRNAVFTFDADRPTLIAGTVTSASSLCINGNYQSNNDVLAEEYAVALSYCGVPYAVMLATPCDLKEFAVGFTLSEGIVASLDEIRGVDIGNISKEGLCIDIKIAKKRLALIKNQNRNLVGRTGCGMCGKVQLQHALRSLPYIESRVKPTTTAIDSISKNLAQWQTLYQATGAVHAAVWGSLNGSIIEVAEDVGRHNALDKLIGMLVKDHVAFDSGFVFLTSRVSAELVQKAATVGISSIVALSAPTSMAVTLSESCGINLICRAKSGKHTIYS